MMQVDIQELVLRLPNMPQEAAERIARRTVAQLAARPFPEDLDLRMDHLHIRLDYAPGMSEGRLSKQIADKIWSKVKRQGRWI